jgi:predicted esterase
MDARFDGRWHIPGSGAAVVAVERHVSMRVTYAACGALTVFALTLAPWHGPAIAGAPAPDPYASARATLTAASEEMRAHFLDVQHRYADAPDLQGRIDSDLGTVTAPTTPDGWTDAERADAFTRIADLDASLVDQLATGKFHPLAAVRGLDDVLVTSPADNTLQPISLFVPTSYDPTKPTSLVVFLHGRGWSEADTLGVPFVRDLAQATGTIVAAPYARGDIQFADPAPADVYATLDAVQHAFNIDKNRIYLAGYSMGGFGVFEVAPAHADVWSALMCVSGSLTNEDRNDVVRKFRDKTIYIVSGVDDDNVPHRYSQISVRWLRESNVATRFYAQPGGGHSMATFRPALEAAWNDMLGGVRSDSGTLNIDMMGPLPALPSLVMKP